MSKWHSSNVPASTDSYFSGYIYKHTTIQYNTDIADSTTLYVYEPYDNTDDDDQMCQES